MSDSLKAVLALVASSTIWGLSGIYFDQLNHVPPLDVLAHRVVWSMVFFAAFLMVQGRLAEFATVLRTPALRARLAAASLLISANWFGYIWAIHNGYATQASLGYYIFPLMTVLFGLVLFRERFSRVQTVAILMTICAVLVLAWGISSLPWVALFLALSFSSYGSLKKLLDIGPVMSVAAEVTLLLPLALVWLAYRQAAGAGVFGQDTGTTVLLMLSAGFTGIPLVLFSYASKRLTYGTLGLIQYLNPTLQFVVAMIYFSEPFGAAHKIAFPLIWIGVALYCLDILRQERSARRDVIN